MVEARRAKAHWLGAAAVLLAGCATAPKAVAPGFYGVWVSADTGIHSWLQIEPHSVVNFGFTPASARCTTTTVDIVAKDRVTVPVSLLGSGSMSLRLDKGALVITGPYATQRYVASSREQICRQSAGTYLPGAPYPEQGH